MQQEKEEDPAVTARKAQLLAMLDSSTVVNGINSLPEVQPQDSVVLESDTESRTVRQSCPVQSGQPVKENIESVKENVESVLTPSKDVCATDTIDSVRASAVEMNSIDQRSTGSYDFSTPLLALNIEDEFKKPKGNFTKGCKWAPDGSCLLVGSEDKMLRLFNLPSQVASGDIQDEKWFFEECYNYMKPALTVKEGECIYDFTWYPAMRSTDAESCCFAVTCRDFPVHLWDAWNGKIICSYQPYNHLEQLVAAHSLAFNLDGNELFCGFNRCIKVFRTCRPGKQFLKVEAKDQPGIISCFAFNPVLPSIFVAGSYLGNIGLYSTDRNSMFCRIDGCEGGITQIKFSSDGTKLFSGMRLNNELVCWDLRNPGKMLWSFKREVKTNQRIYFDLDPISNSYLVSGSTNGSVLKWDLQKLSSEEEKLITVKPSSSFVAHKDCCNGVSINPCYPVLATSSGQRHFPEPQSFSDLESSGEENDRPLFVRGNSKEENSVKLWWFGRQ